jgi:hypothetical protein
MFLPSCSYGLRRNRVTPSVDGLTLHVTLALRVVLRRAFLPAPPCSLRRRLPRLMWRLTGYHRQSNASAEEDFSAYLQQ